jgi:outer membrane protein
MKFRTFALMLLVILFANTLHAQKPWSLTDCIDYAHANNLQVKRAQLQADIAGNDLFQSKMNILPSVNASAGRNYTFGHSIDKFTNSFIVDNTVSDDYLLYSEVNLFSGLVNYNAIKANEYNTLSKMQDVEREKIEISFEIATAYLKILFNIELLEVAINQRNVTLMQVDRTEKLVQAGSTAKGDLLEISAQLAAEDLNVTNSKNELNLTYLNLSQILDLDSVNGFEIIVPDSVVPDFSASIVDVNTVYTESLTFLPHIKSAEYKLQAYEKNLAIQKGILYPTLSLGGTWGTGYSDNVINSNTNEIYPYNDQLDLLSSKSISLSLRVPIFNKWEVKNNISNAKINMLDAEVNLDLTKQQLYKEIQQAHNDATSARDKYNSATVAVKSYKEAFGYTEQKFSVGIVNTVEYNIAKNNFIRAESDLLQAKYEYVFALKILDFYRGIPLSL